MRSCHVCVQSLYIARLRLKCYGARAETRKRTSPFKSAGASVQPTIGSRGVRISGCNAGYTMFRGSVKGTGYSLHSPVSPSLPLPCITVCHHVSTGFCIARLRLKCDGTRAETRFRLSAKRTSPFKSAGASVQSTTGRRSVRISLQGLYCSCRPEFCSHVTLTGYPFHSLVSSLLPLPCVTVCHHISTGLYQPTAWHPRIQCIVSILVPSSWAEERCGGSFFVYKIWPWV